MLWAYCHRGEYIFSAEFAAKMRAPISERVDEDSDPVSAHTEDNNDQRK